jgi:hypothetical protein
MYSIDARRPVAPPFFIKRRSAAAVGSTHRGDRHAQKEPPSELLAYMLKIEAGQSHPNSNVPSRVPRLTTRKPFPPREVGREQTKKGS